MESTIDDNFYTFGMVKILKTPIVDKLLQLYQFNIVNNCIETIDHNNNITMKISICSNITICIDSVISFYDFDEVDEILNTIRIFNS